MPTIASRAPVAHVVRRYVRLARRDQVRLAVTWSLLGCARLLVLAAPFSLIRRLLGDRPSLTVDTGPSATSGPNVLDARSTARAARIGTMIAVAARHTPWRSECYPQALTARALLGLSGVPHVVSFGVRRDAGALRAHAWVRAGDIAVTGGSGEGYTEVGTFTWTPRHLRATP